MAWELIIGKRAEKQLIKLDHFIKKQIIKYLQEKILKLNHPKQLGKALVGNKKGLWRYRIEDFRVICQIEELEFKIILLAVGNRGSIYNYE